MNPQLIFRVVREISDLIAVYPELEEDETLRADTLEGETDINNVLAKLVQEREAAYAMAEGVKAPVNDLRERKARLERRGDGYGEAIERVMAAAGLSKVTLPSATISVSLWRPMPVAWTVDRTRSSTSRLSVSRSADGTSAKNCAGPRAKLAGVSQR